MQSVNTEGNHVEDLFGFGGWFDRNFGEQAGARILTWRASLSIFVQRKGSTIVETGCQRQVDDLGDGSSTKILARMLNKIDKGILHSVDISPESLQAAKIVIYQHVDSDGVRYRLADRVRFHLADSVDFLKTFDQTIDFLYLDSADCFGDETKRSLSQTHQLKEIEAAYEKLSPGAVVVLDDNDFPSGGKTKLSKQFLSRKGWYCLLDWTQSVWIRSINVTD